MNRNVFDLRDEIRKEPGNLGLVSFIEALALLAVVVLLIALFVWAIL